MANSPSSVSEKPAAPAVDTNQKKPQEAADTTSAPPKANEHLFTGGNTRAKIEALAKDGVAAGLSDAPPPGDIEEGGYRGFKDELAKRLYDADGILRDRVSDAVVDVLRETLSKQFPEIANAEGDIFLNLLDEMKKMKPPQNEYAKLHWDLFEEKYRMGYQSMTDSQKFHLLSDHWIMYNPADTTVNTPIFNGEHVSGFMLRTTEAHEVEKMKTAAIELKLRSAYNGGKVDSQGRKTPEGKPSDKDFRDLMRRAAQANYKDRPENQGLQITNHQLAELLKTGVDDLKDVDALFPEGQSMKMVLEQRLRIIQEGLRNKTLKSEEVSGQLSKDGKGDKWIPEEILRSLHAAYVGQPNGQEMQAIITDIQKQLGYKGTKLWGSQARMFFNALIRPSKNRW